MANMTTGRWHRDVYRDALWESEDLDSDAKAVAETYARHARDDKDHKGPTADLAWLTYERLMVKAGIRRRANVAAAVRRLVDAGWLTIVVQASRRPTVYRLTIPGSSDGGTTDEPGEVARSSDGGTTNGTTVVPLRNYGSSTLPGLPEPRSSDGGTPPLEELPLSKSPSLSQATTPDSLLTELGADERERDELIQKIKNECQPQTLGWWITASRNGTLLGHLEAHRAGGSAGSGMPAWCGTCDKDTRQIEAEDQYGGGTRPRRCPDCHPSVVRQPPPARRQNGGWSGPHLNSTDPHAFDGYKPHARENVNAHQPYRDKPTRDYRAPL